MQALSTTSIENLISADKTRHLNTIFNAIYDSVMNGNLSLQQIETALRDHHCTTHLIARKRYWQKKNKETLELPLGTLKTYYLFLSVKDEAFQKREVLKESATYEDNFNKLNDTGFIIVRFL